MRSHETEESERRFKTRHESFTGGRDHEEGREEGGCEENQPTEKDARGGPGEAVLADVGIDESLMYTLLLPV